MSVLLDLPSYLFYQIVIEWIDPTLFLAFTHLDNAVKCNSNLRLLLLNQFTATKDLFDKKTCFEGIHFDWTTGYYCDYFKEQRCNRVNVSSFAGLHLVITKVCCKSIEINDSKWIECCEMKYLVMTHAEVLLFLSESLLQSLESVTIFEYITKPTSDICLALKHCKKLKAFHCYSDDKQLLLDVVANNFKTLTCFRINGTKESCYIIANCKRLEQLGLNANDVLLCNMLKLIGQLPLLTFCEIEGDCFIEWSRTNVESRECDEIKWTFRNSDTLQSNMQILLKYFKYTTTSIEISESCCNTHISLSLFQSVLEQCTSLKCIEIEYMVSNLVECFKNVTPSLTSLIIVGADLSDIIKILNYCKRVTKANFYNVNFLKVDRDEAIAQVRQCIQDRSNITVKLASGDWKIELIYENGQSKEYH